MFLLWSGRLVPHAETRRFSRIDFVILPTDGVMESENMHQRLHNAWLFDICACIYAVVRPYLAIIGFIPVLNLKI
jgi:hypothetical protein